MAKATLRVDDRVLRRIIANVANEDTKKRTIHDGVEYGIYNEFGTHKMSAKPSLRKAWERHVTRNLEKAVGAAIEAGVSVDDVLAKMAFDVQGDWMKDVRWETGTFRDSITVSTD